MKIPHRIPVVGLSRKTGGAPFRERRRAGFFLLSHKSIGSAMSLGAVMMMGPATNAFSEWKQAGGPVEPFRIAVFFLVLNGNDVYLGNNDGFFRSTDNGGSWKTIASGMRRCQPKNYALLGNTMYAATPCGLYAAEIENGEWRRIEEAPVPAVSYFASVFSAGNDLFLVTDKGVARSGDRGKTWSPSNKGLRDSSTIKSIMSHSGNRLLAHSFNRIYLSADRGATWILQNSPVTGSDLNTIASTGDTIVAATGSGLFTTTNPAAGWRNISPDVNDTAILLGMNCGKMYTSPDRGASWHALPTIPGNTGPGVLRPITAMANVDTVLFAGTDNRGIFRSLDNGASWQPANYGLTNLNACAILSAEAGLFAGTQQGVYVSADKGLHWRAINTGLPPDFKIAVLAAKGSSIFAAANRNYPSDSTPGSIYRFGADSQWNDISGNLSQQNVTSIAFGDSVIFAGTDRTGIYYQPLSEAASIGVPRKATCNTVNDIRLGYFTDHSALTVNVTTGITSILDLSLYSLTGRKIASIFTGKINSGRRCFHIGTGFISTGVYLLSLKGNDREAIRMVRLCR